MQIDSILNSLPASLGIIGESAPEEPFLGPGPSEADREADRFAFSKAGLTLLESEQVLGAAEALPGQGKQPIQENGVEIPDLHTLAESSEEVVTPGDETRDEPSAVSEDETGVSEEEGEAEKTGAAPVGEELSDEDQAEVDRLKVRDREVRAHEHAHVAAGGQFVRGGIQYEYETGPDGKRYAVGGEVSIDTSPVADDPDATIRKAQTIRRAAMAPAEPSGQDRQAAAAASQMEAKARQELVEQRLEGKGEEGTEAPSAAEGTGEGSETEQSDSEGTGLNEAGAAGETSDASALLGWVVQDPPSISDISKEGVTGSEDLMPDTAIEGPEAGSLDNVQPVTRLDYGARSEVGQLMDVYG